MDAAPRSIFHNVVFFRSLDFFDSFVNNVACSHFMFLCLILGTTDMSGTCEMDEN